MRDSKAALDLMYRRSRCLADFETANKNLDRARQKNKDLQQAETVQQNIKKKFETISEKAKDGNRILLLPILGQLCRSLELNDFKVRRVQMFRKNLIELTELQIKHAKVKSTGFWVFFLLIRKFFLCSIRLKFKQSKVPYNKAKPSEDYLSLSVLFLQTFSFNDLWFLNTNRFSSIVWARFSLILIVIVMAFYSFFCIYPSISYFYFGYPMNISSFLISRFPACWHKEGIGSHRWCYRIFGVLISIGRSVFPVIGRRSSFTLMRRRRAWLFIVVGIFIRIAFLFALKMSSSNQLEQDFSFFIHHSVDNRALTTPADLERTCSICLNLLTQLPSAREAIFDYFNSLISIDVHCFIRNDPVVASNGVFLGWCSGWEHFGVFSSKMSLNCYPRLNRNWFH